MLTVDPYYPVKMRVAKRGERTIIRDSWWKHITEIVVTNALGGLILYRRWHGTKRAGKWERAILRKRGRQLLANDYKWVAESSVPPEVVEVAYLDWLQRQP